MNLPLAAQQVLTHYGYLAIAVGTFFEGEAVMLAAGAAAAAGLLSLPLVILASMGGIFSSDTFCFYVGRLGGGRILRWFPRLHRRMAGVFAAIERHDHKLIFGYQFVPGLCAVTPLAFGMTRISAARFLSLDLVGNAAWSLVFGLGGFACGEAFAIALPSFSWWAAAALAVPAGVGAVALIRRNLWPRLASSSA